MATLQLRVDDSLKAKADALFSSLGLDTSTAVRIFLASSKAINTVSAFFDSIFTAFPGKALLSCNITGIFSIIKLIS